ncbi:GGDEF domain-containing protein [Tsukamurella sp. M9C]|uniref:GGDEF domain-containing protein n=1 Tax=Tsukamurella sp. M9C TaxID=2877520 RepID=UPI001CCD8AA0|nr:GGDEF domain-containing protein [Tsukamurella sp. M9C]MCA0154981.1 GGDEF domain-containing protein [Tsukamurella sp. M9C]
MTTAIRYLHGERTLRIAVALLAMMMLPLALVMQFNPMGPQGVPARVVHLSVAVIGFLLGVRWLVGRWPSAREAMWFLFLSDLFIGIAVAVLSDPTARICGTIHLAMVGLFAAFFLGWRILLLHCVYALLLIAGLTGHAILTEGRTLVDLYVYTTPAITTVVGLPVVIQVVVELGRHGAANITQEWNVDSLTGAYSRRGMNLAIRRTARRATDDGVVLVGALDLDGFKQFNDTRGHGAGDQLLRDVVDRLKTVPRVLVGRFGGDEFGIVAFRGGSEDAARTLGELRALLRPRDATDDGRIPGSLGIVIAPGSDRSRVDDLALDADAALYEAKRSATSAVVVRDLAQR